MAISKREDTFPGSERGVRDPNYFMDRVKEERQRTDRSGKPFSIVLVDFRDLLSGTTNLRFFNGRLKREILDTILDSSRCTDIKGWYESDKLGLLCTETDESGASILVEKLQRKLEENLIRFTAMKDLIKDKIILTSSTYPTCTNEEQHGDNNGKPTSSHFQNMNITEYVDQKDYSNRNGKSFWKLKIGFPFMQSNAEALELSYVSVPVIASTIEKDSLSKAVKRLINIAGSLTGIIIALPFMLIIGALIKITSSGPIFFRQERLGHMGQKFTFFKFRSMYTNVDHMVHQTYMTSFIEGTLGKDSREKGSTVFKLKDDPRITPFGKFLRKTSFDELPQLFNVLKGEMSLVGPRPPIPYEVDRYKLWHRKRIMEVKPGITGLWQVSGRSSTTFEQMVRLDLYYVNHWSLRLDIIILLKTIKALLSTKGAY